MTAASKVAKAITYIPRKAITHAKNDIKEKGTLLGWTKWGYGVFYRGILGHGSWYNDKDVTIMKPVYFAHDMMREGFDLVMKIPDTIIDIVKWTGWQAYAKGYAALKTMNPWSEYTLNDLNSLHYHQPVIESRVFENVPDPGSPLEKIVDKIPGVPTDIAHDAVTAFHTVGDGLQNALLHAYVNLANAGHPALAYPVRLVSRAYNAVYDNDVNWSNVGAMTATVLAVEALHHLFVRKFIHPTQEVKYEDTPPR
jgi:hypothetical protein